MSEDLIRYDILAQDALRGVVKKVLTEVSGTGLPGEHHFYITFNTQAPGVRISPRLLGKYPKDMTIVLQHQFWDMQTSETAVEIGLSFDGIPEKLYIPYTSIISFIDPSVHFSLQFEVEEEYDEDEEDENLISEEEQDDIILSVIGDVDEEKSESPKSTKDDKDQAAANAENKDAENVEEKDGDKGESEAKPEGAEVVSLDAFRKK
ncbi:SspB family protein [Cohaesibacter gelatinilyticus]|uniref:Stringent starvation protein B n=1 Tax=Cohaesibacter gelatinilyticus TaxID=372072 RepID=A0A285NMB7_9HYPH|nr:ClpXP protease specificity-enhancing factor SspB [Cohaesibacter gelatinilyticus]SNZ09006.1 hypothetical protein SAMN06265368_1901 [Cohaesibacter gelatinilyticus]